MPRKTFAEIAAEAKSIKTIATAEATRPVVSSTRSSPSTPRGKYIPVASYYKLVSLLQRLAGYKTLYNRTDAGRDLLELLKELDDDAYQTTLKRLRMKGITISAGK